MVFAQKDILATDWLISYVVGGQIITEAMHGRSTRQRVCHDYLLSGAIWPTTIIRSI